jgi:predicted enzyme involved in methoxymalonyl-ACP biosynthesis
MVLREILLQARASGIERLIGIYIPTDRNALVRDHYAKLGFSSQGEENGATFWEISTDTDIPAAPMIVHRAGLELTMA